MEELIPHSDTRDARLNIRANLYQKEVIAEAARIRHTTISNFILATAYQKAQEVLASETNFKLPAHKWEAFCKILDREPCVIKPLKDLLTSQDTFDND